ncbi:MAG TPA: sulfite exporter TauE/SafE family protein [Gemmataceae bacterium]|nr:sulfite exporter TauE/SafE family protein [Gemmataceae bacterium]
MDIDWAILPVLGVLFLATLIRSAFGFGEALIAVPLLAFLMPVEVAVPLATLVSITVAGIVVAQDWQHIQLRSAGWLVFSTLFGIPLGLLLLTKCDAHVVKAILAIVIVAFSTYCLLSRRPFELKDDRLAWLFGFGAGVLGGAYGMNGPPLAIYGTLRRWSAEHFRATLQGYFLPASVVGVCVFWLAGLWTAEVTRYYLLSLPVALVAIVLGQMLNRRLKGRSFIRYVHVGLIVVGTVLLVQSLGR